MKNKKVLIAIIFIVLISLLGVTYAFFEYYGVSADYEVKAGVVTLTLNEGKDYIDLTNIFPETKEEARLREDNIISFTISGVNTTENKDIWYEIMLNEGDEVEGLTRFLPKELMFDLTEINPDGTETLVVDNMNFGKFEDTRIWVNTILRENETEFTRTYKLRMWLSDRVLISDTYEGTNYTTSEFRQRYASVRVSVFGDFTEKSAPYNYMKRGNSSHFWPTSINNVKSNITQVNFVSLTQSEIDTRYEAASIKVDVTDTSKGGSVKAWLEIDTTDATKYIMYVASDGITYFPSDCSSMFSNFSNLNEINFDNINTNLMTNMQGMFYSCKSLSNIDLSNFNTSQVTTMMSIFAECSKLTEIDLSSFDTSMVTNMARFFDGCSGLTKIDLSPLDTSSVTSMNSIFNGCSNLTEIDLSPLNTSKVTDMLNMFRRCKKLTEIDLSPLDTSSATMIAQMFEECISLIEIDLSSMDTSIATSMGRMFNGCSNLISVKLGEIDTSSVTNMSSMFKGCNKLKELDLSVLDTSSVTNMSSMFQDSGFKELDLSSLDTSFVTDMSYMFYSCGGLKKLDLSSLDTSSVTNMNSMFSSCRYLESLDLSGWNTSQVTDMSSMFAYCTALIELDLSLIDTNSVTKTYRMFRGCSNLTTIYANIDWNIEKITASTEMFYNCSKLVGAVPFDSSKTDITMANPTTGYFTIKPTEETPSA